MQRRVVSPNHIDGHLLNPHVTCLGWYHCTNPYPKIQTPTQDVLHPKALRFLLKSWKHSV